MATIPWSSGPTRAPEGDPTVLGSRLTLRRWRDLPSFLAVSMRLHRAAAASPGCVDVTLRAVIHRREFSTASRWRDEAALHAFVRSPLHRRAMVRYADRLAAREFATWTSDRRPNWEQVAARLGAVEAGITA